MVNKELARKIYKISICVFYCPEIPRIDMTESVDCYYAEEEFYVAKETGTRITAYSKEHDEEESEKVRKSDIHKVNIETYGKDGTDLENIYIEVWSYLEGLEQARKGIKVKLEEELRRRDNIMKMVLDKCCKEILLDFWER